MGSAADPRVRFCTPALWQRALDYRRGVPRKVRWILSYRFEYCGAYIQRAIRGFGRGDDVDATSAASKGAGIRATNCGSARNLFADGVGDASRKRNIVDRAGNLLLICGDGNVELIPRASLARQSIQHYAGGAAI